MAFDALGALTAIGAVPDIFLLDIGDSASYPGSGQTVTDRSGAGNDFYLGNTSGVTAADPTFNGVAGNLSASEYFQFDGNDMMVPASGVNPLQSWHKNNATWSFIGLAYFVLTGSASCILIGDQGGSLSTSIGFRINVTAAGKLLVAVGNGSGQNALVTSTMDVPASQWIFLAVSWDESTGDGFICINGLFEAFTATLGSPTAADAGTLTIGRSPTSSWFLNGSRINLLGAYGSALTQSLITLIFIWLGLRIGVAPGPDVFQPIGDGLVPGAPGFGSLECGLLLAA